MGGARLFSAVNTKVRHYAARMLDHGDYREFMALPAVRDQVEYLKGREIYGEALAKLPEGSSMQYIELLLRKSYLQRLHTMTLYFSGGYREFFQTLRLQYEIEDLKVCLRGVERKESLGDLVRKSYLDTEHRSFDFDRVSRSRDRNSFVRGLEGTIYYGILEKYRREDSRRIIFYVEMELDRLYFSLLERAAAKLRRADREVVRKSLGRNEDLLNVEWIYRGRKFYDLLPEELVNFVLLSGTLFGLKELKKMCYMTSEDFMEYVLHTEYGFLFESPDDVDLYFQRRVERYQLRQFLRAMQAAEMNIAMVIAHLHLLEYEIRDIVAMMELKKYNFDLSEAEHYLIRHGGGTDSHGS